MSIWQNKYLTRREQAADIARDIEGKAAHTLTLTFEYRDRNTNQPVLKQFRWNPDGEYFESLVTVVAPAGRHTPFLPGYRPQFHGVNREPIEARYAEDV